MPQNRGSGKGLVPADNGPLFQPMLTQMLPYGVIWP